MLKIACGARVMLTTNVDVSDGLARGEVVHIVTNRNNEVATVLVKFDNEQVGVKACQSSQYRTTAVPLSKLLKVNVVQRSTHVSLGNHYSQSAH